MQKLHKFLFGALLLGSVHLNAMDLISLATEGKANEQSEGVRILNDEEMSEVVGGFRHFGNIYINGYGYFSAYFYLDARDYNYNISEFNRVSASLLRSGEELVYAQRYRNYQATNTKWLAAYNRATNSVREIPFSSSVMLFHTIANQHYKQYGTRYRF